MNSEPEEFTAWWNEHYDPAEQGRTRSIAARAFAAGITFSEGVCVHGEEVKAAEALAERAQGGIS